MLKLLRLGLLVLLTLTAALPMVAQVRHVTTVNPMTKQSHIEVYEFDYVDIQPQFPGGERGLINFINKTREYPYHAYKNRIPITLTKITSRDACCAVSSSAPTGV